MKIKRSERGLTFALPEGSINIGEKYRYVVDTEKKEVVIYPDINGNITASRKKSGKRFKPLFDIRSREVRNLCSKADFMEVEIQGNQIIVHAYQKVRKAFHLLKSNIVSIEDILCKESGQIILSKVSGIEGQLSLFDIPGFDTESTRTISSPSWFTGKEDLQKVYDVVSLFSGAGLLDYSFRDPQFRFVYGVDFDKDACDTYRENIGNHIECRDIRDVNSKEIPDANLIIGGPCCQGYSNANRQDISEESAKVKRLLIDDYIRLVKDKNPEVFVIENVPQLLTKENGMYIKKVFEGLPGYQITASVISDDMVGGYTVRKRAIVIGSRIGEIKLPDAAIHTVKTVRDALSKIDSSWYNFGDISVPSDKTKQCMSYVKPGHNWKDIPESVAIFKPTTHSDRYYRLDSDKPSPTIVNWRKICMMPPSGNRILSVAEAAALMGLDKNFHVLGSSLGSKQQQIGNGVTQAIGNFVKKHVLNALNAHFAKTTCAANA